MTRDQSGRRRTPQQRKRDAQRGRRRESAPATTELTPPRVGGKDGTNGAAAEPARGTAPDSPPRGRGGLTGEQMVALANTQWSLRGRLTLALLIAVLLIPFGLFDYALQRSRDAYPYSLAYHLIRQIDPRLEPIPIPLVLATFVGMPLARLLAREPRPLRMLETLGFVAVVQLCLIAAWGPLPRSLASYTDAKVVATGAFAATVGLVVGAYLYGPFAAYLSAGRRRRRRR